MKWDERPEITAQTSSLSPSVLRAMAEPLCPGMGCAPFTNALAPTLVVKAFTLEVTKNPRIIPVPIMLVGRARVRRDGMRRNENLCLSFISRSLTLLAKWIHP